VTDIYLESGPKRVFACAVDWPGWCRVGRNEEQALEALAAYASRYAVVAKQAGLKFPSSTADFDVVERVPGSASTDFGVPVTVAPHDLEPLAKAEAERLATLVEASWTIFDRVAAGAPAELRKGPRGGGRDRDKIVDHVVGAEALAYAPKLGLRLSQPALDDAAAVAANRAAIADALRTGAHGKRAKEDRGWPTRYAARRIAWHVMDHAWEIQDRSQVEV
jgi:hypothetical protein